MIFDTLDNIELYQNLSSNIYAGLVFLREATADIEIGVHIINPEVKAIVSSYETVDHFERGYEPHRNSISY